MQTPIKEEEQNFNGAEAQLPQVTETRPVETQIEVTMEERLARVGAKIDDLIQRAAEARDHVKDKAEELKSKGEATCRKSGEAFDELKVAMNSAWEELNHAWEDIQKGTERAVDKFRSE